MGQAIKIVLLLGLVAVTALIAFFAVFFFRPIATTVWFRRNALRRIGLQRRKIATTVGEQMVWHGGSGPLLVLLHGAGDQAGTWHKVAPQWKRHFQLVIPDLAGHGESDPVEGVLGLATLLTALEQVLAAIPWRETPLVLAGNSLGAWMAMLYAQKHPRRVSRVLLIDGGPIKSAAEIGLMPKNREEAKRAFEAVLDPATPRPPSFVLDDFVRVSNIGPISRLLAAGKEDMSNYLLDGQLASFPLPVDLIWGASDRLVPLDYAKTLQSQLPRSTLTVIAGCGHAPQLERPHKLTQVVLQVLASHSTPASATVRSGFRESGEKP